MSDLASLPDVYHTRLLGRFEQRVLTRPAVRWTLLALLAATLLIPSFQFFDKLHETTWSPWRGERPRSALGRWIEDLKAAKAGEDPYGYGHWFPYPPTVLVLLYPLTFMPLSAAGAIFAAAKIAAVIAAACFAVAALHRDDHPVRLGVFLVAALFSAGPVISDIQHGNINVFVLLTLTACWYAWTIRRDVLAGLLLALAITIKITPALLLLYFLYRRQWRLTAAAAIGLVLFALVLPALVFGPARNTDLLVAWFDMLAAPYVLHGYITDAVINQSLPGVLVRWFRMTGFVPLEDLSVEESFAWGTEHMTRPATLTGVIVLRGAGLTLLALLAWLCRSPLRDRRDPRLALECALVLLAMLLLSERTWKHHMVTLLFVYLALWHVLVSWPFSKPFTAAFVTGLTLQFLFLEATSSDLLEALLGERSGEATADAFLNTGLPFLALLLAFAQTAVLQRRVSALLRTASPTADHPSP